MRSDSFDIWPSPRSCPHKCFLGLPSLRNLPSLHILPSRHILHSHWCPQRQGIPSSHTERSLPLPHKPTGRRRLRRKTVYSSSKLYVRTNLLLLLFEGDLRTWMPLVYIWMGLLRSGFPLSPQRFVTGFVISVDERKAAFVSGVTVFPRINLRWQFAQRDGIVAIYLCTHCSYVQSARKHCLYIWRRFAPLCEELIDFRF